MMAYVTNVLAACITSKLTSNLQSMSHWHQSGPAQYQAALLYIERWFIFSNHRKMVSKLLSLNRCEENHDDIGTISRFDINWTLCFSVLVLNITILWTILGLRKIVHHHPLDTDKILFVLYLTEPVFYKTLVGPVGSPVHGECYSGIIRILNGACHCGKYISSLYSSTPKIIIFGLHNSAFVCGNQVS